MSYEVRISLDYDTTLFGAKAAYESVVAALQSDGVRFAAVLRELPEEPEPKVIRSRSSLWSGGDLGG